MRSIIVGVVGCSGSRVPRSEWKGRELGLERRKSITCLDIIDITINFRCTRIQVSSSGI